MQKRVSLSGSQLKELTERIAALESVKLSYKGDLLTVEAKDQDAADRIVMDCLVEIMPPVQDVDYGAIMRAQRRQRVGA